MRYLLCAAAVALTGAPAAAATFVLSDGNGTTATVYDNRAEWLAALSDSEVQEEGFEDAQLTPGLHLSGTDYEFDGTLHQTLRNTANYLSMDFATGAKAVAFDYALIPREGAMGLALSLNFNNNSHIFTSITSESGFYGVIGSAAMESISFEARRYRTQEYRLDNFAFQPANVPEPAVWGMLILGFGAIGAAARTRRPTVAYS